MKFSVVSGPRAPGSRARIQPQASIDGRYVPEFRPVLRTIVTVARFRGRRLNETVRNAFQRNYAVHRNPFIALSICDTFFNVRFGSKADICDATSHVRFTPNCDCKSGYLRFVMSALPPKADMCCALAHVRFGPKADSCIAAKKGDRYSITSSARASNVGGTDKPSALAVVRLMTRSNLVGCATGRSEGFAPRRILSTYSAARRNWSGKFAP